MKRDLIEKIKNQTEQLWNTIKEAEKANLKVYVDLSTSMGRLKPEIVINKEVFSSGRYLGQ